MLKHLLVFLLLAPGLAAAGESSRIDHAFQGAAGVAVSANYVKEFAPERPDLYKHVIAGGAISSVLGSLADDRLGLTAGVVVAAGKELVNDAWLGNGQPQLDDFAVTAASAIFCSRLSSDFAPMVFVDRGGVDLQFRCRF